MAKVLLFRLQQCFDTFTMLPLKGLLKQGFLDSYLTTYFGVSNFGNTSAMLIISCWEMFKI